VEFKKETAAQAGPAPEAPPKILLVDDEQDPRVTLSELLEMKEFTVTATDTGEKALTMLENEEFDLVLTDLFMPRIDGIALTRAIKSMGLTVPVIVMTGFATIEAAVETMKAGASDFITKPFNIDQIIIVIDRTLETKRLQKLAQEREYYEHLSNIDGLTELYNHRYFHQILLTEIEREKRYRRPLSLMIIDVDNFKDCNDSYGHLVGDVVLKQIGALIKKSTRGCDFVARYGGEEFSVILPETSKQEAAVVAERIRTSVEEFSFSSCVGKHMGRLTVTIGLASLPEDAQDKTGLIEMADKGMYRGKESGKNRVYTT
jgi:diguanylate cyclase (GGDEF)-like protein